MQCYYHSERKGVKQCINCGKWLCQECADTFTPTVCTFCAQKAIEDRSSAVIKSTIILVLLCMGGIIVGIAQQSNAWTILFLGACFGGMPTAWRTLNFSPPKGFLMLLQNGMILIFLAVKIVVCFLLSWIFFAVKVYQIAKELSELQKLRENL